MKRMTIAQFIFHVRSRVPDEHPNAGAFRRGIRIACVRESRHISEVSGITPNFRAET